MAYFRRPLLEWRDRLESARSLAEVLEACQDFVARFAPSMLAQLPRTCRPPAVLDSATVSSYAFELVRHELAAGDKATPMLSAFALFFTDASQAIARIAMARRRPDLFPTPVRRR
jgi:hypothetical protein